MAIPSAPALSAIPQLYTLDGGDYEVELSWEDSDGQDIVIYDDENMNFRNGHKSLLIMAGDFDSPDIFEFSFERSELEDEFYLYGMSAIDNDSSYDLYIAGFRGTFFPPQIS